MLKIMFSAFAIAASVTMVATPAFSQNRFMDEAREQRERLKENEAIRKAERPEAVQATTAPSNPAPAEENKPLTVSAPEPPKVTESTQ